MQEKIKRLVRYQMDFWFINGWKADCVVFKAKWKAALMWLPLLVMFSSILVFFATRSVDIMVLMILGFLLYIISMWIWQTKAYEYIMDKEGIGKRPNTVKKPEAEVK